MLESSIILFLIFLMKVILLQRVSHIGNPGDVLSVSDGYARNFLLPRKLAVIASSSEVRRVQERKNNFARTSAKKEQHLLEFAQSIDASHLRLKRKASPTNTLYQSITARDILKALEAEYHVALEEDASLVLAEPIKSLGEYKVQLRIAKKEIVLSLSVEKE